MYLACDVDGIWAVLAMGFGSHRTSRSSMTAGFIKYLDNQMKQMNQLLKKSTRVFYELLNLTGI